MEKHLTDYIAGVVYPQYSKNDIAHQLEHVLYVTERSLKFAKSVDADEEIAYVVAAYHDLGCAIDRSKHEIISAQIFLDDKFMEEYFNDEQREIIAEAIEDHRASCDHEPRSIYGRIISTADRDTNYDNLIKRVWKYNCKNNPDLSNRGIAEKARAHIIDKFGKNGYAKEKIFFEDHDFFEMCDRADTVTTDIDTFVKEVNKYFPDVDFSM